MIGDNALGIRITPSITFFVRLLLRLEKIKIIVITTAPTLTTTLPIIALLRSASPVRPSPMMTDPYLPKERLDHEISGVQYGCSETIISAANGNITVPNKNTATAKRATGRIHPSLTTVGFDT